MKTTLIILSLLLTAAFCADASVTPIRPDSLTEDTITVKNKTTLITQTDTTGIYKELEEVVIEGNTVKRRGNEDIWTITSKMRKGTRNAGDLIGKLQGVTYNPITKEIYFQGSQNIKILVDSIERDEEYIKRLGSGRFDRINVIQNPQGKYMGYEVVINLHTRRHYEGYEGNTASFIGVLPTNRQGKDKRVSSAGGWIDFTYTRDKWNFVAFTNIPYNNFGSHQGYTKEYPLNDFMQTTLPLPGGAPVYETRNLNPALNLSVDWQINANHSLSLNTDGNWRTDKRRIHTLMQQGSPSSHHMLTSEEWQDSEVADYASYDIGVQYRGTLPKWGAINGAASIFTNSYNSLYSLEKSSGFNITNNRRIKFNNIWADFDTNHWFNPKFYFWAWAYMISNSQSEHRLETGEKLSSSSQSTTMVQANFVWYPQEGTSLGITVGGDLISQKSGSVKEIHLSPRFSANASWQASKNLFFRLNYNTSASGPGNTYTQDYGQFTDSLTWQGGNPDLKPMQSHNISLSASVWRWLSISASYFVGSNSPYSIVEAARGMRPDGIDGTYARYLYQNGTSSSWNTNVTMKKAAGKHWDFSLTLGLRGNKATWEDYTSEKVLPNYYLMAKYTPDMGGFMIVFNHGMNPSLNVTPQGRNWVNGDWTVLSVQKLLLSRSLELSLNWNLPVHLQKGDVHGGMNSDVVRIRYNYNNLRMNDNRLNFKVSYRFQGGKSVRKYSRTKM